MASTKRTPEMKQRLIDALNRLDVHLQKTGMLRHGVQELSRRLKLSYPRALELYHLLKSVGIVKGVALDRSRISSRIKDAVSQIDSAGGSLLGKDDSAGDSTGKRSRSQADSADSAENAATRGRVSKKEKTINPPHPPATPPVRSHSPGASPSRPPVPAEPGDDIFTTIITPALRNLEWTPEAIASADRRLVHDLKWWVRQALARKKTPQELIAAMLLWKHEPFTTMQNYRNPQWLWKRQNLDMVLAEVRKAGSSLREEDDVARRTARIMREHYEALARNDQLKEVPPSPGI